MVYGAIYKCSNLLLSGELLINLWRFTYYLFICSKEVTRNKRKSHENINYLVENFLAFFVKLHIIIIAIIFVFVW